MKKILLMALSALFAGGTVYSQCPAPEVAPWLEDFTGTSNPGCWTQSAGSGGPWIYNNTPDFGNTTAGSSGYPIVDHTNGVANNYAWVDHSGTDVGVILQTPEIDITGLTIPELSFWTISHNNSASLSTYNSIFVEASDGAGGWTSVGVITGETGPSWVSNIFNVLPFSYGANLVQFRFRVESGGDTFDYDNDMLLDDVMVRQQPTCIEVSDVLVSNITGTDADVVWTDNAGASSWEVEYGLAGFTPGSGTSQIVGTPSFSISGLSSQTDYDVCVRAICAPGDTASAVCANTFTTQCGVFVAPFLESFDVINTTPNCWTESGSEAWRFNESAGYDAASIVDHTGNGGVFAWIDGSTPTGPSQISTITSPLIDVSTLGATALRFWMFSHNTDDNTYNTIDVEYFDGAAWTNVFTNQASTGPQWSEILVDLSAIPVSGNVQLRFTITENSPGVEYYNDILIDDIELFDGAGFCFAPSDFTFTGGNLTTADFSWNTFGSVGDYVIEYGVNGFVPGTFPNVENVSGLTTASISGLTPNTIYEAYIYSDCGTDSSDVVGPLTFNTFNQGVFIESNNECGPGFTDISLTGTQDLLATNGEVGKTLPWVMLFNGVASDEITIGNHGDIYFGTLTGVSTGTNGSIAGGGTTGFYPFWDYAYGAYEATDGVFTQTVGTAPNRQYIIQYNVPAGFNGEPFIYQVVLDEATSEIYFIYEDMEDGITDDNGNGATIGVVSPNQGVEVSLNNTEYLENNTCARFYYTNCPKVTDLTSLVYDTDTIVVSWNPGLAGETNWTIEYGPAGFIPGNGTSFTTTNTQDTIVGLNYLTDYDVYVYADCDVALQSVGNMITVQTAPICATPTGVTANALQDSIGVNWMWTGTFVASTGFNIQYGLNGAGQYGNNTTVAVDNNLNDTILDNTLLGGTLYDVYVQAVCGTDTSLYAGPFTIITPLTNDTTCSAIGLNVDGTVYNFNNSGATVGAGEANIAPPNTGLNETDGWSNSTLNNTTWFTFVAPASGNVYITGQDQGFAGQMAVYSVTDCGDYNTFTLEGANDNAIVGGGSAPGWVQCGLTAGNTYYLMHDGNSNTTGNYSIRLEDVELSAGSFDTPLEACSGDTVDLFTAISGQEAGGDWIDYANTFQLNGSIFATTVLATGVVYDFEYRVTRECAYDSVIATVEIYGPSQAGNDGTMTVCQNQPTNLFSALNGTADVGGTWYDPSDNALPNATPIASNIPGQFNYDYIVGNGVCPDDTALVVITVDASCDYLGLEDMQLEGISIFPNPASEILTIASNGSHEALNVQVVDVNGRVVYTSNESVLVGSTLNIDVTSFETGVYILRLYNNEVENTYRVVVK